MTHLKLILTTLFCLSTTVQAADMVVALSPHQSQTTAERQVQTVLKTFCDLPPATTMTVMDGYALQTLATLEVPDNPRYQHCKTRLKLNGKAVAAIMQFAKRVQQADHPAAQAVLLPQLLHHVAQFNKTEDEIDVVVFGSPLYHDARSPTYSMADGLIPSDGHLRHGRADTPFGIDDGNALAGVRLHLAYDAESVFATDQHRALVKRFWSLYMAEQGGVLARFTADHAALLNALNAPASQNTYTLEDTDKMDMIRLRQDEPTQTIYERPLSNRAMPTQNLSAATDVEIGVTWNCDACDLDLYARPSPRAEVLYFNNSKTPQGVHLKDFTSAPQTENGFETIVFNGVIDLRALDIVVNFYSGRAAQDIHGTLRIAANGEVYAHRFTLSAKTGNRGKDVKDAFAKAQYASIHTITIDPVAVVSITRS